jgi:cation diffusion facilitator CzcD-associated flavoprotein CzcO
VLGVLDRARDAEEDARGQGRFAPTRIVSRMSIEKRVCVIGAGPAGIAAAKNCAQSGIDFVVFEKNDKVGGNWVFNAKTGHSSVYENTHIISSKAWSEYEDFPMPPDYPDYPNHRQLQAYFESYAKHFRVYDRIRFNHAVTSVKPRAQGGWDVVYADPEGGEHAEIFDVMMVANGHHWNPKFPDYEGRFDGKMMHSHDFKGVDDEWRGKNVLVIGAGNSACDVAVESARVAGKVCISMRGPQWFVPKFIFGQPSDVFAARTKWLPPPIKQRTFKALLTLLQGSYTKYGLPVNTDLPLSHHPTLNSDFLDFVRHGRIKPRPGIARLDGDAVVFTDRTRERFDIVCACTGFWITFPFFEQSFVDFKNSERVPLLFKMLHAEHPTLYFIGLFQPIGCIWPLADYQARLACQEILGNYTRPADMRAAIKHEMDRPHFKFSPGSRHSTQVDYHRFRAELAAQLKTCGIDIGAPPQGMPARYKVTPVEATPPLAHA